MPLICYFALLLEAVNYFYTSKYGFKEAFEQPLAYQRVRTLLKFIRYPLSLYLFIILFPTKFALSISFLVFPYMFERILFAYCRDREKQALIKMYMDGNNQTTKKQAEDTANVMIDIFSKDKSHLF